MEDIALDIEDVTEANLIRRALMTEIPVVAVDVVVIDVNKSPRHDEIIALRLGLAPVDNEKLGEVREVEVDVSGPLSFTTDDIPEIPFVGTTSLVELREGHRFKARLILREGTGREHVKFCPVSAAHVRETEDGIYLRFKNLGMYEADRLIEMARGLTDVTAERPSNNIFSRQMLS